MPKMGVRARIADWPPKREGLKDLVLPSTARDLETPASLPRGFQNEQLLPSGAVPSGCKGVQRLARRRSKDAEFQDGWPRSPGRGFLLLRNRSSSEITLSECDLEEAVEPRGVKLAGGLPLFREYGSTSSIDAQGISEQNVYAMLNEFRSGGKSVLQLLDPGKAAESAQAEVQNDPGLPPFLGEELPLQHKDKARKKGAGKAETGGGDSIFRKLRSGRGDPEGGKAPFESEESRGQEGSRLWLCQKSFSHYDVQSLLFDLHEVVARRAYVAQRRNTATGASAASAPSAAISRPWGLGGLEPAAAAPTSSSSISPEDLNDKENLEHDPGDKNSNDLLLSCPHFRNEIGGLQERNVSFSRASAHSPESSDIPSVELCPAVACTNASVSVLEVPKELQRNVGRLKHYSIEHVDLGARYYQDYFYGKGSVAHSLLHQGSCEVMGKPWLSVQVPSHHWLAMR